MKTLLLLLCLVCYTSTEAQYNINWVEAPLNEIPLKYKLEHFNLKGPVKQYKMAGNFYFDKQGYLIYGNFGSNFEFTYDENHKLLSTSSWLGTAFKPLYPLVLDAKGRVIEKKVFNNSEIYTYDANGNWTGTVNQLGNRKVNSYIYTYDTKNRVIKAEYYDHQFKVAWEDTFSYAKDGAFVAVTTSRKNNNDPSNNFTQANYYKNGVFYGSTKNDNVQYDRYGNVIMGVRGDGSSVGYSMNNYIYYGDEGVSDVFEGRVTEVPKVFVKADPNCTKGNCKDGLGDYKYDNGSYFGFFENGTRQGFGIYTWTSGQIYSGQWNKGVQEGYGSTSFKDGSWLSGYYKNGKLNGLGLMITSDKKTSYGIFTNGSLTTTYDYYANTKTTGCTAGDCVNKYGQYIYKDGSKFIGYFKNGYMHQGTWYSANGNRYTGQFGANNRFEGYGEYVYKNNDNYMGSYKNGKREGHGVFYYKATRSVKGGEWKDDVLIKEYDY